MPRLETIVLIPESTRKQKGAVTIPAAASPFELALPPESARRLRSLRQEMRETAADTVVDPEKVMPGYLRYQGNMYRHIPQEAWESRAAGVDVLIVSGLYGLVGSRDPVAYYECSMAEPLPPLGKLNRWWHDHGLPEILAAFLGRERPRLVVDLLSLEYREAVAGTPKPYPGSNSRPSIFPGWAARANRVAVRRSPRSCGRGSSSRIQSALTHVSNRSSKTDFGGQPMEDAYALNSRRRWPRRSALPCISRMRSPIIAYVDA